MNIKQLEKIFLKAKLEGKDLAVELTVPERQETEVIIIKNGNLDYKLDYYRKNYTEKLVLNRCKDIKIINAKIINFDM